MSILKLVCSNKHFLILLLSSCLLSIGAEFNYITLSTLIDKQNGIIGFLFYYVLWCIVPALISFVSGPAIDYFDKKKIIVISFFLNSIIISGFILAYKYQQQKDNVAFYITLCCFFVIDCISGNTILSYIPEIVNIDDLISANSINAVSSRFMSIIGVSIGGIVLYYTDININLFVTMGIFFLSGIVFSLIFCIKENTEINSDSDSDFGSNIVNASIAINSDMLLLPTNNKTLINMIKEGYIYLIQNKNILYITIYKALLNVLLSSFVIINYYFAYKKFSNNIPDSIKLFTICNSIEVIFVLVIQVISQKYSNNDLYRIKKIIQYAFIPIILSTLCYAFSYNYYIWWLGNALFGCGNIIFCVSTNTVLQIETKKDIQGRIFTYGYNLRIIMCAIGAIYTTLFIKYEILCIRDMMFIFTGFYIIVMFYYSLHYLKYYA